MHVDGRPHHYIPYTKLFKQDLILKSGVEKTPLVNEYNMIMVKTTMAQDIEDAE
jgi:hypothetical protein